MRLKDKVAIVTGGARGIGAAIAVGFAREGARIVIGDKRDARGTVAAVEEAGSRGIYVKTDVAVQADCDALARAAADHFGAIDILVNNAGVLVTIKPFMEVTTEEWNEVMASNALGPFQCIKAVFPYMKERGGRIINLSSGTIFEGVPGLPHYIASKGAVMALTRGMARELGSFGINVNAIAPGFTHSEGGTNSTATSASLPFRSTRSSSRSGACRNPSTRRISWAPPSTWPATTAAACQASSSSTTGG